VTAADEGSVRRLSVQYPGGLAARYRWGGSGSAEAVFGISEADGTLNDYGPLASPSPDAACRAEIRVEGPVSRWTVRLASPVYDEPEAVMIDSAGLLVVKFGFVVYAIHARTGELAWSQAMATPTIAVLGSSRLDHLLVQCELETFAYRFDGSVAWRAAHSDVIVDARLIAGRLALTAYSGEHLYLDAETGQAA
jgi:hypothetical protein